MKRDELRAEKLACRDEIKVLREKLQGFLLEKSPIPRHIVDAPLSKIIAFKDAAEKVGGVYHVQKAPGKRQSLGGLQKVKSRLIGLTASLGCE